MWRQRSFLKEDIHFNSRRKTCVMIGEDINYINGGDGVGYVTIRDLKVGLGIVI